MQSRSDRFVLHLDADCFYVQVERLLAKKAGDESLEGVPIVVVQYNPSDVQTISASENRRNLPHQRGTIIAVSYEAKKAGVKRLAGANAEQAKTICPELVTIQVPTKHGKADLSLYREASREMVVYLSQVLKGATTERASVDEIYMDVTEAVEARFAEPNFEEKFENEYLVKAESSTWVAGENNLEDKKSAREMRNGHQLQGSSAERPSGPRWFDRNSQECFSDSEKKLVVAAVLAEEVRRSVRDNLGYTCTAGVASNKMLAKLSSAMNKPNKQTIFPDSEIEAYFESMPFDRVQGFGGLKGKQIDQLLGDQPKTMGAVVRLGKDRLRTVINHENTLETLWLKANGRDPTEVKQKELPESIAVSKTFPRRPLASDGFVAAADGDIVEECGLYWCINLCKELYSRLDFEETDNGRIPRHITFGVTVETDNLDSKSVSKTESWPSFSRSQMQEVHAGRATLGDLLGRYVSKRLVSVVGASTNDAQWHATNLSIGAADFEYLASSDSKTITELFSASNAAAVAAADPSSPTSAGSTTGKRLRDEQKSPRRVAANEFTCSYCNKTFIGCSDTDTAIHVAACYDKMSGTGAASSLGIGHVLRVSPKFKPQKSAGELATRDLFKEDKRAKRELQTSKFMSLFYAPKGGNEPKGEEE